METKLSKGRLIGILTGVLYIIGTVSGIFSYVFALPVLNSPDILPAVSANPNAIIIGALLVLTMGLALALVPVVVFPVLKEHNETLAIGYLVFRGALETFTYMITVFCWLALIPLSREFAAALPAGASNLQLLGRLTMGIAENVPPICAIVFSLGAVLFYIVLYQGKLVPRWISLWGLITVVLNVVVDGVARLFISGGVWSILQTVGQTSLLPQEMVMAVWLIVKGFPMNPSNKAEDK